MSRLLIIAGVIPLLTAAFTVAGMLYVTLKIDWRLGLIAAAILPPLVIVMQAFMAAVIFFFWKR